ncbi:MAG TPA: alpha/beta hydrolase family protein, partial [Polyangiaceae bacterium]|nr:alpha/beta hydrolase family protein [Polyangiaceae bacterium]
MKVIAQGEPATHGRFGCLLGILLCHCGPQNPAGSGGAAGAGAGGGGPSSGVAATVVSEQRSVPAHSARLWELTLESRALGKQTRARLLVPARYLSAPNERWPVLYLLHGGTDDYKSWSDKTALESMGEATELLIVMPDSGFAATYSDWYNGGNFGPPRWETYHLEELRLLLEQRYRANGRYVVAGLSSGGYGSMKYAARHPDLFRAAASFSGNLDRTSKDDLGAMQGDSAFTSLMEQSAPHAQWGDPAREEVRWRTHNPVDLAPNLRGMPLSVATGDGRQGGCSPGSGTDPVEAAVLVKNQTFTQRLNQLGIAFTRRFYSPGTHTWCFWQSELQAALPMLKQALSQERSAPAAFSYRSAEDAFSVWSWTFQVSDRAGLAFTDIDASASSVAATGNGRLQVTTPPAYQANRRYRVGSAEVQADA